MKDSNSKDINPQKEKERHVQKDQKVKWNAKANQQQEMKIYKENDSKITKEHKE
jgi:hypothetical protein